MVAVFYPFLITNIRTKKRIQHRVAHLLSRPVTLPHLKDSLGGVALHVVAVDDDLDDAVPHLLADVVARHADEVEDSVYVPGVVHGVLLRQNGHLEDLEEGEAELGELVEVRGRGIRATDDGDVHTHYFLPDGVVRRLQVAEHLRYDLLRVAAVTHGVEEVHGPLAHTNVTLRLKDKTT